MKYTSQPRTLLCLSPQNRRKVIKCIDKENHIRPPVHEELSKEILTSLHDSQLKTSKQWFNREKESQIVSNNELYERMKLLDIEEFNQEDFKRKEYDSYSLILYKTLVTEVNLQRRELKYLSLFGDKWRSTDEDFTIKQRIDTSLSRIERFSNRERDFKKKYFQNSNYLIKGIDIM
tara:strand:- start:1250 stop:1777 length:528 start_codon:yes stop_codon:yes gene_type:complete